MWVKPFLSASSDKFEAVLTCERVHSSAEKKSKRNYQLKSHFQFHNSTENPGKYHVWKSFPWCNSAAKELTLNVLARTL